MIIKPPPLQDGDKVGVFVPASPIKEPYRTNGIQKLRQIGYEPVEVENVLDVLSPGDFLAKAPQKSVEHIRNFFEDNEIKALWAGRGGYGSNHLLPLLDQIEIPVPKIIIGSSDISYLLWYFLDHRQMMVFYGPMIYSSLADNRFNYENLKLALQGNYEELHFPGKILIPGKANGIVTGGCLSNFVSVLGTPYFPKIEKRILLLEDVGERPYRLDRMFWQIYNSGLFNQINGLLLGKFPGCFNDSDEKECFFKRVSRYFKNISIPIIYDLPLGHCDDIHTLPLGINAVINTSDPDTLLRIELN